MKLQEISVLTFQSDRKTAFGRTKAQPQLRCIEGDACDKHAPETVQCRNVGMDENHNTQWACSAEMNTNYKFGFTHVSCEGQTSSEDVNILPGSCGLEYSLHSVDEPLAWSSIIFLTLTVFMVLFICWQNWFRGPFASGSSSSDDNDDPAPPYEPNDSLSSHSVRHLPTSSANRQERSSSNETYRATGLGSTRMR